MKFATLTASTAVFLLSSTAMMAQGAGGMTSFENVYVDVGGQAIQVPVAQAAQACGLDETAIQQVASTRLEESGLDPAIVYGLGNETASATGGATGGAAGTNAASTDTAAAGTTGTTDTTDMASADAGAAGTAGSAATETDMAAADAGTTGADATAGVTGTDTAATPADSGTTGMTSDMATADATGSAASGEMTSTVEGVESTAADTSAAGSADPMMQLVVCQIDQAQATQAGIDVSGAGAMGSTATE